MSMRYMFKDKHNIPIRCKLPTDMPTRYSAESRRSHHPYGLQCRYVKNKFTHEQTYIRCTDIIYVSKYFPIGICVDTYTCPGCSLLLLCLAWSHGTYLSIYTRIPNTRTHARAKIQVGIGQRGDTTIRTLMTVFKTIGTFP